VRALIKHPLLDCDLEDAALWYHLKQPGIEEKLINEVERTIFLVVERPLQFPTRFEDIRRAKIPGFPHGLYFVATEEAVFILALIHGARDVKAVLRTRRGE
jgi:plasmid stabilization system protein ParE